MWIIGTGLLLVHDVNEPLKEGYMPRVGPNVHFCQVSFLIVPGVPAIKPGDDLAGIVLKTFPDFQIIIGTGLLLLHQPHKTSRNLVSTTIHNFRYEGRRSIAL